MIMDMGMVVKSLDIVMMKHQHQHQQQHLQHHVVQHDVVRLALTFVSDVKSGDIGNDNGGGSSSGMNGRPLPGAALKQTNIVIPIAATNDEKNGANPTITVVHVHVDMLGWWDYSWCGRCWWRWYE
jgi:hypothetical protein